MMKALLLAVAILALINAHPVFAAEYQITMGESHACVIDADGVKCWGSMEGAPLPRLNHPTQVSAGHNETCALDADGVKCWGITGSTRVPVLDHPTQVSAGYKSACAIHATGVKCWGDNSFTSLGRPRFKYHPTQISTGISRTCAIDADRVRCWGLTLAMPNPDPLLNTPRFEVPYLDRPTQVAVGAGDACAIDANGVTCWGNNRSNLRNVPRLNRPTQVVVGGLHACALDADGVKCWGSNDVGQTNVPRLNRPSYIAAHDGDTCAIDTDGVKCWGRLQSPHLVEIPQNLRFSRSFSLSGTRSLLGIIAAHTYAFDREYFESLSSMLTQEREGNASIHRFALLALIPHLRNLGYSGEIESILRAEFNAPEREAISIASLSKRGAPTLASIERTPELNRLAIRTLSASIRTSMPVLTDTQRRQAPAILTLLANALSGDAASSGELLQRSLPDLERFFTEMSQNSYLRGRAASGLAILEYLK